MIRISLAQERMLEKRLKDPSYKIPYRSANALRRLEYLDEESNLKEKGKAFIVSKMRLNEQCEYLGVVKRNYILDKVSNDPEYCLLQEKIAQGYAGVWAEGRDILLALHACSLNVLKDLNPLGREDAEKRYIEAQFHMNLSRKKQILCKIAECKYDEYKSNYHSVYKGICSIQDFVEIDDSHIDNIYNLIIKKHGYSIAELLFEDPYKYRKGWPDLTLIKNEDVLLLEVKEKDRLIESQIDTLPKIKELGFNIEIGKVIYRN